MLRSRQYGLARAHIAGAWERLLDSGRFRFQARPQMELALDDFRKGPADLSDYLILYLGLDEGAEDVVTFDGNFVKAERVSRLG